MPLSYKVNSVAAVVWRCVQRSDGIEL